MTKSGSVAMVLAAVLSVAGCGGGDGGGSAAGDAAGDAAVSSTTRPEKTTTTVPEKTTTTEATSATTAAPATSTTTTAAPTTAAPTTAAPTTTEAPGLAPFPVGVPAGECTVESVRQTTGLSLEWGPECVGAWAIGQAFVCDPDIECESVDILRWTDAGWQYRDLHYAYCALTVQMSGMPRAINDQLIGDNSSCVEPVRFSGEPASGALSLGHEGPRVAQLQAALIDLRLLNDVADGRYGPNTHSAVIDLQFLAGIPVTMEADAATHGVLGLPF